MQNSALIVTIICAFFLCSVANAQTLKLSVLKDSNNWWFAVTVLDGSAITNAIEVQEAGSGSWVSIGAAAPGWGYWSYNAPNSQTGFSFPLSFRLTSVNGHVITLERVVSSFAGAEQIISSMTQYSVSAPTQAATQAPPAQAATSRPTAAPTAAPTQAATAAPTQAATAAPTQAATAAPTQAATAAPTQAPTAAPTQAATSKPTAPPTQAPTAAPTKAATGCSAKMKVLVPLYVYPGATWDTVAAGARSVETVAIINPYNGPKSSPDANYVRYMQVLHDAGVEIVGYVYTGYGNRDIAAVKADIDTYATQYPLLKGIFLDEAASGADKVSYYKTLYEYITSMPGWTHDIINPGVVPDTGYLAASSQIVTVENYGSYVPAITTPSMAKCDNKEQFSAIVHTVGVDGMRSIVDGLMSKNYFGYLYVTDGAGGCCTYNTLTSYYSTMVAYIASKQQ